MTVMVTRLVKGGLLRRARNRRDAKAYNLRLTLAGREALATGEAAARKALETLLAALPADDRAELVGALKSITEGFP